MRRLFYWLILLTAGYAGASAADSWIKSLFAPVAPVDLPAKGQGTGDRDIAERAAVGRSSLVCGSEVLARPWHPIIRLPRLIPAAGSGFLDRQPDRFLHIAAFVAQQDGLRNPPAALPDYFESQVAGVPNA